MPGRTPERESNAVGWLRARKFQRRTLGLRKINSENPDPEFRKSKSIKQEMYKRPNSIERRAADGRAHLTLPMHSHAKQT